MNDSTIERKLTIFISSKINERYNIVRKALKSLLLETGMVAYVYAFETEGASSQDVRSAYLKEVSLSNLCIFLIDNADGISDAVLAEHERAAKAGIHRLYFFCDEKDKNPTPLQNELMISSSVKYCDKIHEFSDFSTIAYKSVLQDIIDLYRGTNVESIDTKKTTQHIMISSASTSKFILRREVFKNYTSESELVRVLNPYGEYMPNGVKDNSLTYDCLCANFLSSVIGQRVFNEENFTQLKYSILSDHEEDIKNIVELRLDAISSYFNNNLEECYSNINQAYEKAKNNSNIPQWCLNDIAIDMRNVKNIINEINNIISYETDAQKMLDNSPETVYYPLLDRFNGNSRSKLLKEYFEKHTESPYSWRGGTIYRFFDDIASSFNISVRLGSLTHILAMRENYADILFTLYIDSYDIRLFVELIKIHILLQNDKKIENIVDKYNQSVSAITPIDIDNLIISINTLPFNYKRLTSLCLMLEYFGYYFNDEQYAIQMAFFIQNSFEWCVDNRKIVKMGYYILKTIKSNIYRIDNQKVSELVIRFFKNNIRRYYREVLEITSYLDFTKVSEYCQIELQNQYISLMKEKGFPDKDVLQDAIIALRMNSYLNFNEIDNAVKSFMPEFYNNEYDLEFNKDNLKQHIDNYIKIAMKRNQKTSASEYSAFAWNPFDIVRNIIKRNNVQLSHDEISNILIAIEKTLVNKVQQADQKNSAIILLLYLKSVFTQYPSWADFLKRLDGNSLISAITDPMFEIATRNSLEFNILLMKIGFSSCTFEEAAIGFAKAMGYGESDFISIVKNINLFLSMEGFTSIDSNILGIIINFILSVDTAKHKDAQYYATKSLIILSKVGLYETVVLERLAYVMSESISNIRISILSNIKDSNLKNKNIEDYILQKGRTDNHYLVKKLAEEITESLRTSP